MKLQIELTEEIVTEIDKRSETTNSGKFTRSSATEECLDRYFYILKVVKQEIKDTFTAPELSLIVDSSNGTMFQAWNCTHIDQVIEDSMTLDGLDQKWGVDREALLAKLRALTTAQSFALVDAIEAFWRAVSKSGDGTDPQPSQILE